MLSESPMPCLGLQSHYHVSCALFPIALHICLKAIAAYIVLSAYSAATGLGHSSLLSGGGPQGPTKLPPSQQVGSLQALPPLVRLGHLRDAIVGVNSPRHWHSSLFLHSMMRSMSSSSPMITV